MDVSLYFEISDSLYIEWITYQIKKNVEYLASKGLAYEVICNITNKDISKNNILEHLDVRFGTVSISKAKYISVFIQNLWYPDYRVHFQWRYLDFYNKNLNVTTNSYTLVYNPIDNKTYIDMSLSEMQALTYKKSLNLKDFSNNTCLKGHKIGIDEEVQLVVDISNRMTRSYLQDASIMTLDPFEKDFISENILASC